MANAGKGGIILGAHAGNWEIAGHLLSRLKRPVHIVIYDGERSNLKELMEETTGTKSFHVIPVKDNDMQHIYEIKDVLSQGDLVAMHGDRFRDNSKTYSCNFFGKKARFPLGPYYLAAQFDVPLCFVHTIKETNSHYHFYSTPPLKINNLNPKTKLTDIKAKTELYAETLEKMMRKYPLQWFNYYNFWNA
jgi:predicted LPLAT superfamily acyltransferase